MSDAERDDGPETAGDLAPTWYLDSDHPAVAAFAKRVVGDETDPVQKAIRLFYAVRDEVRYDPYSMRLDPEYFRAHHCLEAGKGYCVYKASLMAAACRAVGIPARVGLADVRNHLCTERLKAMMDGSDMFYDHGYVALRLEDRWVKVTPVFNIELCEKFGVVPQEFDGRTDALFQPFDAQNRKHMEYITDHGTFDDLPFDKVARDMETHYPRIVEQAGKDLDGDFAAEAEAEN